MPAAASIALEAMGPTIGMNDAAVLRIGATALNPEATQLRKSGSPHASLAIVSVSFVFYSSSPLACSTEVPEALATAFFAI